MKNKLMILAVLLPVVLVAAGVLYNNLSEQMQMDNLSTLSTEAETTEEVTEEITGETQGIPSEETTESTQPQDMSAPDFTVVDREGNQWKLSDFVGKPVVLNFWASWCGPCKSEMPDFEEAFLEYGDQVHFLMVNLTDGHQETVETAYSYVASQGYTFPVYYDTTYSAAMAYGVSAVPMTIFIDAEGNLVAYAQGAINGDTLQRGIDMILPAVE